MTVARSAPVEERRRELPPGDGRDAQHGARFLGHPRELTADRRMHALGHEDAQR